MAVSNYAAISQRTAAWAATEMLSHAEPVIVLSKFGATKPVPKNKADNVKFRRANPFAVSTTPLTEGVKPTSQALTYTDVAVTLNQYGQATEITDRVVDMAEDPVLRDASTLSGEQAGETLELVTWGAIKAGTNVGYANGVARNAVNTAVTLPTIRTGVRALQAARARPVTSMLDGSPKYGTVPVEGGYIAFGHTDLEQDIRGLAGFTPVAQYGSRQPLCPQEVGSVENVRFILSPVLASFADAGGLSTTVVVSTTGTNADVYPLIIVGKEAFGCVPLKGSNAITPIVVNPDNADSNNPLGQFGFVSWKAYFNAVILNEAWMYRCEVGASEL
jgi:N4-gp56 family major capsid protein